MRNKELKFGEGARKKMLEGLEKVNDAVKVTIGSRGRTVILQNKKGSPIVTLDGVSIAKTIQLSDPFQNLGASLIIDASRESNEVSGDGSTTTIILTASIAREGLKAVSAGHNPMMVKKGIDKAVSVVVAELKKEAKEITSSEEIAQVASISANNDNELGSIIAKALETVGKDGIITVEESKSFETYVEYVEGLSIDRGYMSPYFATDREKMITSYDDPYVLILDGAVPSMQSIIKVLEICKAKQKPLLIIAEELQGEVLNTLALNIMRGTLDVCAIKSPSFGEARKNILEDIAISTGGSVISSALGKTLDSVTLEDLGSASKIVISKEETLIIEGKGEDEAIRNRISQLKTQKEECTDDYAEENLQKRLAKLSGGVAILNIGATTEVELKEKKDRVEDALGATRSAIDEGIVAGGGTVLAQISTRLLSLVDDFNTLTEEEKVGFNIVKRAIEEPIRQIATNAGLDGAVVANDVKRNKKGIGFNANTLEYVDMLKEGIVDSVRTTRTALQSASSIASLLLTTSVAIVDEDRSVEQQPMPRNM